MFYVWVPNNHEGLQIAKRRNLRQSHCTWVSCRATRINSWQLHCTWPSGKNQLVLLWRAMFANVDNDGCIRQCRKQKIAVIVTFMFAFCMFVVACSCLHVHCWIVWAVPELFVSSRACEIIMTHNDDCKLLIAKCICAIRLFEGMWDYSLQSVDCKLFLC